MRPRDSGSRPVMVLAGVAILALGILIMMVFVVRPLVTMDDQPSLSTSTTESLATAATENDPSPLWAAAGGLTLAIGTGLIGIGLNSWRAGRPRSVQHDHR